MATVRVSPARVPSDTSDSPTETLSDETKQLYSCQHCNQNSQGYVYTVSSFGTVYRSGGGIEVEPK